MEHEQPLYSNTLRSFPGTMSIDGHEMKVFIDGKAAGATAGTKRAC